MLLFQNDLQDDSKFEKNREKSFVLSPKPVHEATSNTPNLYYNHMDNEEDNNKLNKLAQWHGEEYITSISFFFLVKRVMNALSSLFAH